MIEIRMPRLSDTMEEGAIVSWLKHPGDPVEIGDVLVEIETDKAVMQYEAYEAGTLAEILVPEGKTVTIGTPIAQIDDGAGAAPAPQIEDATVSRALAAGVPGSAGDVPSEAEGTRGPRTPKEDAPLSPVVRRLIDENHLDAAAIRGTGLEGRITRNDVLRHLGASVPELTADTSSYPTEAATDELPDHRRAMSPLVRRLAREHNLDLSSIRGSGPGGRIVGADVERLVSLGGVPESPSAQGQSPDDGDLKASERFPLSSARRVIARRLSESAQTIPHFYVTAVADVEALVQLRAELNDELQRTGRPKVSINDLLVRACALALRGHPMVNVSYLDEQSSEMLLHHRVNIGIAVAADSGLVVPVLPDADKKPVTQIASESKELITAANERRLTSGQMTGGTFTISNLGMFGVEQFTAIINPPEAAILAVGGVAQEAVVVEDETVIRHRIRYTLSVDHRAIDGALAAKFLQSVTRLVEHPLSLLA